MDPQIGWPICDRCGRRVGRYEPAWIEHADGHLSAAAILDLDARARRDATRVWHEGCRKPPPAPDGPVAAPSTVPAGGRAAADQAN